VPTSPPALYCRHFGLAPRAPAMLNIICSTGRGTDSRHANDVTPHFCCCLQPAHLPTAVLSAPVPNLRSSPSRRGPRARRSGWQSEHERAIPEPRENGSSRSMTFRVSPSTYTDGLYQPQIARAFSLLGQHKFASGMPGIACDRVSAHRHSSRDKYSRTPTVYHMYGARGYPS
jgi:hypothetical protein